MAHHREPIFYLWVTALIGALISLVFGPPPHTASSATYLRNCHRTAYCALSGNAENKIPVEDGPLLAGHP